MANGQQIAQDNLEAFIAWIASKSDEEYRSMEHRGVLSRTNIAKECGFARSALDQNPRIKKALQELEADLRERGVLPQTVAKETDMHAVTREPSRLRAALEAERLRRLEQENAALRAEVSELKVALGRFAVIREALEETGRLPR